MKRPARSRDDKSIARALGQWEEVTSTSTGHFHSYYSSIYSYACFEALTTYIMHFRISEGMGGRSFVVGEKSRKKSLPCLHLVFTLARIIRRRFGFHQPGFVSVLAPQILTHACGEYCYLLAPNLLPDHYAAFGLFHIPLARDKRFKFMADYHCQIRIPNLTVNW